MSAFPKNTRNTVHRLPKRAHYDREVIYPIVDSAYICHVAFTQSTGQPFIIPTIHVRHEDVIYLHGSKSSRMLSHIASGAPVCISITHLDGLVLARSTFHSSMNYRSAVLFGTGQEVTDFEEKTVAMAHMTEHLMAGRWADTRPIHDKEINATTVIAIEIEDASAKIRIGDPIDDDEDYGLPIWAGVVPVHTHLGTPRADTRLDPATPLPPYLQNLG